MPTRIAINGFGRIGRLTARHLLTRFSNDVEIVAVNDLTDAENLAYLFEFDSTYRRFPYPVSAEDGNLVINKNGEKQHIKVFAERDPALLPWKELNIDVVLECTGFFLSTELAGKHLQAGAKKVILSAPAKDADIPTLVIGVNDKEVLAKNPTIVSNASCTTNCVAPAFKVIEENFKLENAFGVTAHAYTATQPLQDGPSKKDLRGGRAAAVNAIPAATGAAKALTLVLPQTKGKVELSALRIPTITGSMVYITANFEQPVTVEAFNAAFKKAAENELAGVLHYSQEELVSTDIIQDAASCVFDSKLTEVNGKTVKFIVWYDNEWGYSNRLAELTNKM